MDSTWELPSLRGTIKLGGSSKSPKLNSNPCFDIEFYPYTPPGVDPVFAVCGGTFAVICRCVVQKDSTIEILRWFEHESLKYNSVVWSQAENGDPLVCVTGDREINVLNVRTGELVATLIGHGDDINDLAVSPIDPTILASGSADNSVRIWSLHPDHEKQPLAAICYGPGHRDQILTLAYHRRGGYILSAGMDTKINLWAVPNHLKEHAGTDKPALVRYPHFSTTEIHTDFVDCVQWYNDLILSKACRENKIVLWRIDGFNSDRTHVPPAPIPTSSATNSRTPVTLPAHSTSSTRSAWHGRFQQLLQFDLPYSDQFYLRFSIFHELGRHPILVAGDERSKASFWDLERLEQSHMEENGSQHKGVKDFPNILPGRVREGSSTSNASSAVSAGSITTKAKQNTIKEAIRDRGICDPFRSIKAHKVIEVPKYQAFSFRQFAWSRDGQWCVGVGDCGLINVFHRWEKGVPPLSTDGQVEIPIRQRPSGINEKKVINALVEVCEAYELRKQVAEEQGLPFDEILNVTLGKYVESLPQSERVLARSLEEQQSV